MSSTTNTTGISSTSNGNEDGATSTIIKHNQQPINNKKYSDDGKSASVITTIDTTTTDDSNNDNDNDDYSPLVVVKKEKNYNQQQQQKQQQSISIKLPTKIIIICTIISLVVMFCIIMLIGIKMNFYSYCITKNANSTNSSSSTSNTYYSYKKLLQMRIQYNISYTNFITKLENDYGFDTYEKIFLNSNNNNNNNNKKVNQGKTILFQQASKGLSQNRFLHKVTIKILQSLLLLASNEEKNNNPTSNNNNNNNNDDSDTIIQFIWATGGHSAAAGHGNFFSESYTAQLQRMVQPLLYSVFNIQFTSRNYAMGATSSGNEIGICSKEIFGIDIDILSWDYGMTDGYDFHRSLLYFYRSSLYTKSTIICLTFNTGPGYQESEHWKVTSYLDSIGGIALQSSDTVITSIIDAIPDTFGLTDNEINTMPSYIQNFKCDNKIEDGEPYCSDQKYNITYCPIREHMASWHPGWKWHALMGNLMALFVIDTFGTALHELLTISNNLSSDADFQIMLQNLQKLETNDYNKFIHSEPPIESLKSLFTKEVNFTKNDTTITDLLRIVSKEPNYCHTARLPAEIRFTGILTESNKTGSTLYDTGFSLTKARSMNKKKNNNNNNNSSPSVLLTYDEEERYDCIVDEYLDFKDFFVVFETGLKSTIILPNDAEIHAYNNIRNNNYNNNNKNKHLPQTGLQQQKPLKGVIVFCLAMCYWGKCPPGVVTIHDIKNGDIQFTVNGQIVSSTTILDWHDCNILTNNNVDDIYFQPNNDGKFEIGIQVIKPNSFLRISSFIVW